MSGQSLVLAGATEPIETATILDVNGAPLTGLTDIEVSFRRVVAGVTQWLDFVDATFRATPTTYLVAMTQVDATRCAGSYRYLLNTSAITNIVSGDRIYVEIQQTSLTTAKNAHQKGELLYGYRTEAQSGLATPTNITAGTITTVGTVNALAAGSVTAAAVATGAIDADALAADAVTEIQSGLATAAALATVQADTDDIQTRLPAALVAGRIDASVGAMAADVLTSSALAASAVTEIQSGLAVPGSAMTLAADAITSATIAAGAIGASEAPLLANLDAAVSSRASAANLTTAQADITTLLTRVDVASSTLATAANLALVAVDTTKSRRALWNRRTLSSLGLFTLYADDAVTALATATVTDVTGGAITVAAGDAARTTALV